MSKSKNMYDSAIFVRVKRFNHTFFILCDEYEDVSTFKNRLIPILEAEKLVKYDGDNLQADDIRLCLRNRILENGASCHDQQVFNDTEVFCLVKKAGTKDEYEDLAEVSGQLFEYEYPVKKKEDPVVQVAD